MPHPPSAPPAADRVSLRKHFAEHFGQAPVWAARAPGRVNLIGEHTDYNEGWVLPCAIDRDTLTLAAPRSDRRFRVWARDLDEQAEFEVDALARRHGWIDYVQAVVFALVERGVVPGGFDLAITSRVPLGSGLSSSAALGVSVATLLDRACAAGLGSLESARVAHRGESHFVGVGCGILDHFASALGRSECALQIDCRSQDLRRIAMPPGRLAILLVHSGVTRQLAEAEGGYRKRVAECAAALDTARAAGIASEDARALRDLGPEDLPRLETALSDILFRRARHVITENERVARFCRALESGELDTLGAVLREGQQSLRDDYDVSTPELDALCADAEGLPGVIGSRLTGAGWGGCSLHLVAPEQIVDVGQELTARFEKRFARRPALLEARAAQGAEVLEIGSGAALV